MKKPFVAVAAILALMISSTVTASAVSAAESCANKDRLYFATYSGEVGSVQWIYANCPSDSTVHTLNAGSATVTGGGGVMALDPSTGNAYLTDWSGSLHQFSLSGTAPATTLALTGVALKNPWGIAIDPATKRIYVSNYGNGKLLTGTLAGKELSEIDLTSYGLEALDSISEVKLDSISKRLYLTNDGYQTKSQQIVWISTASKTGAVLNLGSGNQNVLNGLSIDKVRSKVFWSNFGSTNPGQVVVSGVDLATGANALLLERPDGATGSPQSVLINESANQLYWVTDRDIYVSSPNSSGSTLVKRLDGWVSGLTLLKVPSMVAKPILKRTVSSKGNTFKCSAGTWEADRPWSSTYNAPRSLTVELLRDGKVAKRFAAPYTATFTSKTKGTYTCRVVATNAAGSTSKLSSAIRVIK